VTNVPLITAPDFSTVEFSASESFTVKFFTTDTFDDEDDDPKLKLLVAVGCSATSLDVVVTPAAVVTCAPNVKLLIATLLSVVAAVDVKTLAVEVEVAERVALLATVGLVRLCGESSRLTGVEFVP